MKVGLVVPGFSANAADWCIPALRHFAGALGATEDVRVIAVRYPYRAARYAIDGVDVIALGGAARRGAATLVVWRAMLNVLKEEHRRRSFDVLHAFWATETGLLTALAGRLLGIPTLVSVAGGELVGLRDIAYGDQRRAWERLKVRASLRLTSLVSGGSRYVLGLAEDQIDRQKLRRAPLGVPLDRFQRLAAPGDGPPRVVQVGTLTPVKDQALLLRAFAALRDRIPEATLDIVGDGPLRPELYTLAQRLGVADHVCWRGEIDHAQLPDVYRAGTVFALSSRHEAQGMVALEAAACGLPVVGTRVGVIPELARSPTLVAAVGDPAALATSILEAGPEDAMCAHARAATEFGLGLCTERFKELYASLADQR